MNSDVTISLVIPALNEEEVVRETLQRAVTSLSAMEGKDGIKTCEVILVNDGSTDRTLEYAKTVPGVTIVSYEKNRGYGAAIDTGFAVAKGEYLGFMDADGTCDPNFVRDLWREMNDKYADVTLGIRLHAGSKMPRIRRIGNSLYAWLLSAMAGTHVRDTASGMRLLRRDLLPKIHPLPRGLSYTPAMSARCVMDPDITICGIEMPYAEREGTSKLSVAQDGWRFLEVIVMTGFFYSPLRIFGNLGLLLLLVAGAIAGIHTLCSSGPSSVPILPLVTLFVGLAGISGSLGVAFHFFSKTVLPGWPALPIEHWLHRLLRPPILLGLSAVFLLSSLAFAGYCTVHASTLIPLEFAMGALLLLASSCAIFVTASVFILNQMEEWNPDSRQTEELLEGADIFRVPQQSSAS